MMIIQRVTFWIIQIKSLNDRLIYNKINFLGFVVWILCSKKKTYFIWMREEIPRTQLTSIGRYINVDLLCIKCDMHYAVHHRRLHNNNNNNHNHNIIIILHVHTWAWRQFTVNRYINNASCYGRPIFSFTVATFDNL